MKRKSKLMLIVAAVLVGIGLITCLVGAGVSSAAGDQLFASSLEDGRGYRYDFDGSEIDRIRLDVVDAEIRVIGGAEESYIELLHFNENLYSFSQSRSLISFKESPDISSILRFWESGFTFKGMRYILRLSPRNEQQAINIYLTEEDYVKGLEIESETGNIFVQNIHTDTDYIFTMESGTVQMEDVTTGSALRITSTGTESCAVTLENTTAHLFSLDLVEGEVQAEALSAYTSEINIAHGSLTLDYVPREEVFTISADTRGKLTVNDTGYFDTYTYTTKEENVEHNTDTEEEVPEETLTITGRDAAVYLIVENLPPQESTE